MPEKTPDRVDLDVKRSTGITAAQTSDILDLWNAEFSVQIQMSPESFQAFLEKESGTRHYMCLNETGRVTGWAFLFPRDGETWFTILVSRDHQGSGIGSALIRALQADAHELSGSVIDHDRDIRADRSPYLSPMSFYLQMGFTLHPESRWEGGQISAVKIRWTAAG